MKIFTERGEQIMTLSLDQLTSIIHNTAVEAFKIQGGGTIGRATFLKMIDNKRTVLDKFVRDGTITPIRNSEYKKAKWEIDISQALHAVELYERSMRARGQKSVNN